jgi:hypothetical protein
MSMKSKPKDLLPFPEPPPQMDVDDPRWPAAFADWTQRKAEWYGLEDSFDLLGRALGIKPKTMDAYRDRKREERRANQKRLEDMSESANTIYGTPRLKTDGEKR